MVEHVDSPTQTKDRTMDIEKFIEKEEIKIGGKRFVISKIPAIQAQAIYGEIVRSTTDVGDIGMTFLPTELATRILAFAAFYDENIWVTLEDEFQIDKVFSNLLDLIELEAAMIRKNFGFLFDGKLQKVLEELRGGREAT